MPSYTLELELFSSYVTDVPEFEIWADGVLLGGTTYSVTSGGYSISVVPSYGGSLPTSLEFRFNDVSVEVPRTIEIRSVKINDKYVNTGNYLSSNSLTNGGNATVDIDSVNTDDSDFIFDSSDPAASEFTTGATQTFTAGNDTFRRFNGTSDEIFDMLAGRDVAYLGSGDDKVSGGAGDDLIRGGAGNDLLYGAADNDRIYGGDDDDTIYGGTGNDRLHGQGGDDEIHGGDGDDRLNGNDGNDVITGGIGADKLNGGTGIDYLFGGADNDQLVGGAGDDTIDGGAGSDIAYGGVGVDNINGGDGNDFLIGNLGADIIHGDDGDDTIYIMTNDWSAGELIYGGTGTDELILTHASTIDFTTGVLDTLEILTGSDDDQDVTLSVSQFFGFTTIDYAGGTDAQTIDVSGIHDVTALSAPTVSNLESSSLLFSAGGDNLTITGTQFDSLTSGVTTLDFLGGADVLNITSTSASLNAYGSVDGNLAGLGTVSASSAGAGVTINLSAQTEDFTITGSSSADTLDGGVGDDAINGGGGIDTIGGGEGDDIIDGGAGDDIINASLAGVYTPAVTVADILAANPTLTYDAGTGNFYEFVDSGSLSVNYAAAAAAAAAYTINGVAAHLATITSAAEDAVIGGLVNGSRYGWIALDDTATEGTFLWNAGPETGTGTGAWTNWWGGGGPNPNSGTADNVLYLGDTWGDVWYVFAATNNAWGYVAEWEGSSLLVSESVTGYDSRTETNTLSGGAGNDTLNGSLGSDTLNGGADNDTLNGDAGDDILDGGAGNDTINGDHGIDTVLYSGSGSGVTVDLGAGTATGYGTDTLTSIENVTGSGFNDNITGDSNDNIIIGGDGNDTITGGTGSDTITGGDGNDTLASTTTTVGTTVADILAANPTLTYDAGTGNFYEYVAGNTNYATAVTSVAAYTVNGIAGHLATITSAAEDAVIGGLVNGGAYGWIALDDTATEGTFLWNAGPETGTGTGAYTNWWGGGGPNPNSGAADNVLYWDGGGDVWYVWTATNNALGYVAEWEGAAVLANITNLSTDTVSLSGGDGLDTLYGGAGIDTFIFESASAYNDVDVIENFALGAGGDAIDISDLLTGFSGPITDWVNFVDSGGNTLVQVDGNGTTGGTSFTTIGQINGYTGLDEATLYTDGNIIV